jgi:RNA polymerase sigma factor (sigma-70 family)
MDETSIHVQRAARGDQESVAWVVGHFQPLVEAHVRLRLGPGGRQQDAEDVVSETWLVVLRRLKDIRPREGRWAPTLVQFLGTTALQLCNNALRKRIRRLRAGGAEAGAGDESGSPLQHHPDPGIGVVTRVGNIDLQSQIRGCLQQLTQDKRDVLVMRLMEQRTNQEIAAFLRIPANTVAVRYRRALEELRRVLPRSLWNELRPGRPSTAHGS